MFSHVHVTLLCTQCFYTAGIPVAGLILAVMMHSWMAKLIEVVY